MNPIQQFYSILLLSIVVSCQPSTRQLPIYNPVDVNPELVDESVREVSKNHTVADFNLINQNGETVTQEDYKDKIYVADFFFTRCTTICPIMTNNMVKLQESFLEDDLIKLLSLSVTPGIDSIPVLREYATNKGVIPGLGNEASLVDRACHRPDHG